MWYHKNMNTKQKGKVRYIVFLDSGVWYAVGLEFNIVESGENPTIALLNLFDAMNGHVESWSKVKGSRLAPLNQKTDPEYEKLWSIATKQKSVKSPYSINTFGFTTI
jgi:hypothetical protein